MQVYKCTSVQADGPEEEEKTITRGLSWKRWEKKAKEKINK